MKLWLSLEAWVDGQECGQTCFPRGQCLTRSIQQVRRHTALLGGWAPRGWQGAEQAAVFPATPRKPGQVGCQTVPRQAGPWALTSIASPGDPIQRDREPLDGGNDRHTSLLGQCYLRKVSEQLSGQRGTWEEGFALPGSQVFWF